MSLNFDPFGPPKKAGNVRKSFKQLDFSTFFEGQLYHMVIVHRKVHTASLRFRLFPRGFIAHQHNKHFLHPVKGVKRVEISASLAP